MIFAWFKTKLAIVVLSLLAATTAAGTVSVVAAKNNMGPLAPILAPAQGNETNRAYPGVITAIDTANHVLTLKRDGVGTLVTIQYDPKTKIETDGKDHSAQAILHVNEKVVVEVKDQSETMYATDIRIQVNESKEPKENQTSTPESVDAQEQHFSGTIASIDMTNSTFTITSNSSTHTFSFTATTKFEDTKGMTLAKMTVGTKVDIEARTQNNQLVAMQIQVMHAEDGTTPVSTETPSTGDDHSHPMGTPTVIVPPIGTMPATGDSGK